jgi:hypothetical protein
MTLAATVETIRSYFIVDQLSWYSSGLHPRESELPGWEFAEVFFSRGGIRITLQRYHNRFIHQSLTRDPSETPPGFAIQHSSSESYPRDELIGYNRNHLDFGHFGFRLRTASLVGVGKSGWGVVVIFPGHVGCLIIFSVWAIWHHFRRRYIPAFSVFPIHAP